MNVWPDTLPTAEEWQLWMIPPNSEGTPEGAVAGLALRTVDGQAVGLWMDKDTFNRMGDLFAQGSMALRVWANPN